MIGGLAIRGNLLCVTWSAGRGHVFLYDLEARERVSSWATPAGQSGFSDAGGVAIDEQFRVFVADAHNNRVRRYNAFGQHLGDLGQPAPGQGDRARDRTGMLDHPNAVAIDGDRCYVAMGERPRQRGVQCFHRDGAVLRGLACSGDAAQSWSAPRGVFCDARGLLVADTLRGRVQCFRRQGTFVQHLPMLCDGLETRPGSLVRLGDGTVLAVDHGGVHTQLCAVRKDGTERDLTAMHEHCHDPLAVAVDERLRLYVLDHHGERVVRFAADLQFDQVVVDIREHDRDVPEG